MVWASCDGKSLSSGSDAGGDGSSNPFAFCYSSQIVDLSTRGTRTGNAIEYRGSNAGAPTPPNIFAKPCGSPETAHVVPHAYKMTRTARLRASGYATDAYLWVQSSCTSFEATCSQNFLASPGDPAVVQSAAAFDAGSTVYVLLASGDRGGGAPGGEYRLVVEEIDPVPIGAACDPSQAADPCVTGASCVPASHYEGFDYDLFINVTPTRGVCVADGTAPRTACRADQSCDAPMACNGSICLVTGTADAPCSLDECRCGIGLRWLGTSLLDPLPGTCKADGQLGGSCHRDVYTCDVGMCGIHGTCVTQVETGGTCDPLQVTTECRRDTCLAQGSLANTICTSTSAGAPCTLTCPDSSLTCIDSVCVHSRASGDPCFPRQLQDACPAGEVCAATDSSTGSCRTATAEANEPNDSPGQAGVPVALPAVIAGALSPGDQRDCFTIAVPQGGSVYAELNDGRTGCPYYAIREIELYDPARRLVEVSHAIASPCQILDGAQPLSTARGLAAGNYTLCVAGDPFETRPYHLNIAVH
jgi:hypothetical protein